MKRKRKYIEHHPLIIIVLAFLSIYICSDISLAQENSTDIRDSVEIVNPPACGEIPPLEAVIIVKVYSQAGNADNRYLIFLDGKPVDARWDSEASAFIYYPRYMLLPGLHNVQVFIKSNSSGNSDLAAERTFEVAGNLEPEPSKGNVLFDLRQKVPGLSFPIGKGTSDFFQLHGKMSVKIEMAQDSGPGAGLLQRPESLSIFDMKGWGKSEGSRYDFDFYLTTEETSNSKSRNRYSFKVDDDEGYGFEIGDTLPEIGYFAVDSVKLRGIHSWGTMGPFVLHIAQGTSREETLTLYDKQNRPIKYGLGAQKFWIIRAGLCESENFSIGFNYLNGEEEKSDISSYGKPGKNILRSGDFTWKSNDSNSYISAAIVESNYDYVNPAVKDKSKVQGRRIEGGYSTNKHDIKIRWQLIEPGFVNLGMPYIQDDIKGWSFEDRIRLLDGALSGKLFWENSRNNLNGSREYITKTSRYGGQARYSFPEGGPIIQLSCSNQNRSNGAFVDSGQFIDESIFSLNAGVTQAINILDGRHSIRVNWRHSKTDNDARPANELSQEAYTIGLTSYWVGGFRLDTSYGKSYVNYPARDTSSNSTNYALRASYDIPRKDFSCWANIERDRVKGKQSTNRSKRDFIELGLRWKIDHELWLEAGLSLIEHDRQKDNAADFREKLLKIILTQEIS